MKLAGRNEWPAMTQDTGPTQKGVEEESGISIFDPVLTEISYRWFSPENAVILDPFAGGSVRGIVASKLGKKYYGVDLRPEQVSENIRQAQAICSTPLPNWINGDSRDIETLLSDISADFIFSCPPYADLEVYSDDPRDISTLPYPQFLEAYREIIKSTCFLLKEDRFACFVVGEARGPDGNYYGLVPDTIQAFKDAGLKFYNEAILITSAGSLPIRAGRPFVASRKLGKTHQNVLIFVKGDWKKAAQACGDVILDEALFSDGETSPE